MKNIFVAQKRVMRVMLRLGPKHSCKEGYKRVVILTVPGLYIYSLLMFVVRSCNFFQINDNIHHINTRQFGMLHMSSVRLSSIKRGVSYSSIIVSNNVPQNIQKMSNNALIFKRMLKSFLTANAFYSIDEYITTKHNSINNQTLVKV
jgi:hypothetical protein